MAGVVCGRCGVTNPEGQRFCENCDRFLGWDRTSVEAAVPPVTEPRAAPPAPPAPPTPTAPPPASRPAPAPAPLPIQGVTGSPQPGASGPRHAAPDRSDQSLPPRSTVRLLPMSDRAGSTSTICPSCGTENDPARRFCSRCGEWLITPSVQPAAPPAAFRDRWSRRWSGDRGPYSSGLSRSTIGFRLLVTAAGLVLVTAVLGLANLHPIQRVQDQIGHVRGTGKVLNLSATAQPAGEQPDPTAAWAVDKVRGRGWTTQWTAPTEGDAEAACRSGAETAAAATATSLAITFPSALDVREIGFEAGLVEEAERNNRWQPKALELRWENGECQAVNLENTPDLQRFGVRHEPAGGVLITVVAGYPPTDQGGGQLDIGEVTIWQR